MTQQPSLFDFPPVKRSRDRLVMPRGFRHQDDLIDAAEERDLVRRVEALPFKPFEFQGYVGNRRVASFGWRYDFAREMLEPSAPMPDFLRALRLRIATFTGHDPETLQQALVLEYTPGAGIGWHRDRPQYRDVVGLSLLSACPFRLRCKTDGGWERATQRIAPRSAYLLSGPARTDWEHSIPPLEALRYSVTFRTFR